MFTLSLLVVSFISLVFNTTRLFGAICLTLLSYHQPALLIVFIAMISIYFFIKYSK